jgi:hypothetical protein
MWVAHAGDGSMSARCGIEKLSGILSAAHAVRLINRPLF